MAQLLCAASSIPASYNKHHSWLWLLPHLSRNQMAWPSSNACRRGNDLQYAKAHLYKCELAVKNMKMILA